MYPQQRSRPDKRTARVAWEASWQDDLDRFYNRPLEALPRPLALPPTLPRALSLLDSQSSVLHRTQKSREICDLQTDFVRAVIAAHANSNFEETWRGTPKNRKREIVLEGIYRASCVAWLETRRGLCPDITLVALVARNGDEYLRLLRSLLPQTPQAHRLTISMPIFLPHPAIDRMWTLPPGADSKSPGLKAWWRDIHLDRTYFATMALWNTFLVFHGTQEQYAIARGPKGPRSERRKLRAFLGEEFGQGEFERVVTDYRQAEIEQEVVKSCWHCGKAESTLRPGQHLRACGGCMAIGRKIFYCSRECQVKNWKHGIPRPHKTICGKAVDDTANDPLSTTDSQEAEEDSRVRIPEPDPTFQRPLALLHQIQFLVQPPYVDYTFIFPHPFPDQGVCVQPLSAKQTFLMFRDEALRSGTPEAVQTMYYILIPFADGIHFPRSSLKRQLEREYEIHLQELPASWDSPPSMRHADTRRLPTSPESKVEEIVEDDSRAERTEYLSDEEETRARTDGERETTTSEGEQESHYYTQHSDSTPYDDVLPGTLNVDAVPGTQRTFADKLVSATTFYALFCIVALGVVLYATSFLLRHPMLLLIVGPWLALDAKSLVRVLLNAFWAGHEYVWRE